MKSKPIEEDLIICETASSVWDYHLRYVGSSGPKYGGGAGTALCGKQVGWDTEIPLEAFGINPGITGHWCKKCSELAKLRTK